MVNPGASTTAGGSNGVVCVYKTNFNSVFLIEMIWFVFHIRKNGFLVQPLLKLFLFS